MTVLYQTDVRWSTFLHVTFTFSINLWLTYIIIRTLNSKRSKNNWSISLEIGSTYFALDIETPFQLCSVLLEETYFSLLFQITRYFLFYIKKLPAAAILSLSEPACCHYYILNRRLCCALIGCPDHVRFWARCTIIAWYLQLDNMTVMMIIRDTEHHNTNRHYIRDTVRVSGIYCDQDYT